MAYFSNGTEGLNYQEAYCWKCEHDDADTGCPIWAAHLFYAYDGSEETKSVLDMLIPMVDHTFRDGLTLKIAGQCRFFTRKQLALPITDDAVGEPSEEAV